MLLKDVREQPEKLLLSSDPKREPRSFVIALSKDMGQKRGKGAGSFVQETQQQAVDFYRLVVQRLRPWTALPRSSRNLQPSVPSYRRGHSRRLRLVKPKTVRRTSASTSLNLSASPPEIQMGRRHHRMAPDHNVHHGLLFIQTEGEVRAHLV